jgi:DNA repair exonuclease SbcCD ATPase subunit
MELAVMELAERALSPKGVRPALIEDAFQRLQVAANRVLATCWPGAKVRIDRTSTSQTGKVREESRVLIALPGSETFHPVARLNRGMLRRVDLALQIARRRLYASQCSGGKLPIPYFVIDEALDGIDEEGLTGCAAMLAEEAMANLVVVLTHDEKVVRGVPGKRVTL